MTHTFKYLLVFLSGILLFSCGEKPVKSVRRGAAIQKERKPDKATPSQKSKPKAKEPTKLIVKDKNDYSATFLEELRKSQFEKIELRDSLLIIEERDTIEFYAAPVFGESIVYTGGKDKLVIALTITRKNYTTLTYHLEMVEFGKASYEEDGEAHVSSGFFFGSESEETPEGELYFVDEYSNQKADNCSIQIRLSDEKHSCRLTKSCNGKLRDINRRNFPVLREKNRYYN